MVDAVVAEGFGEGGGFAPGDFGGAEALFHEGDGGFAEGGEAGF